MNGFVHAPVFRVRGESSSIFRIGLYPRFETCSTTQLRSPYVRAPQVRGQLSIAWRFFRHHPKLLEPPPPTPPRADPLLCF